MSTDAMLGAFTQQVFVAIQGQAQIVAEFKDQLEELRTRLTIMKSFLADSENRKMKEGMLKPILPKLRELIYEADNLLTDCLIKDEYRDTWFCVKFSLDDPFFWYSMGRKLKDMNIQLKRMEKSLGTFLNAVTINQGSVHNSSAGPSYHDFDSSDIVGLEDDMEMIKEWMMNSNEVLHRNAIVGMGGLGKTTLAQKVYNDREVECHFDKRIWVSVSQIFNEEDIMNNILEKLQEENTVRNKGQVSKMSEIHRLLKDKSFLIVMDDIWRTSLNVDWWTGFCVGLSKDSKASGKSSCIIITTRDADVAVSMGVDETNIHRPKILNMDEGWSLFCKFAFPKRDGVCGDVELEKIGRKIVEKCGGLPLAIKTVGALMSTKKYSHSEWEKICNSFHKLATRGTNNSIMASLQLSYDELPTHLKQCLLCFSIYPEDFVINAEQLVHWWVGEGLIQDVDSTTATELGFEYLSEVICRCLVDVVERRGYDGRVYSVKMHDMVRELTIMITEDDSLCSFDDKGGQKLTADSRWLGFTNTTEMKSLRKHSKLRALLLMTSNPVNFDVSIGILRSLRVLDFSSIKLQNISIEALLEWITSLKRLAYLNLSGITNLKELPRSIRKLRNLRLLILTGCNSLIKLHPSITTLRKLIVLDLGLCRVEYLPHGLGRLSCLQELSGFRVLSQSNTQSCRLSELKELTQLRILRLNITEESEILESEMEVLLNLDKLKVLAINTEEFGSSIGKEPECKKILSMLDQLSPPPNIQELYLKCYRGDTLWSWINPKSLPKLNYLCVEDGNLANMSLRSETPGNQCTWKIEGLCLKFLPRLELEWTDLIKDMPLLQFVEVSHCYLLKGFPCRVNRPDIWRKN